MLGHVLAGQESADFSWNKSAHYYHFSSLPKGSIAGYLWGPDLILCISLDSTIGLTQTTPPACPGRHTSKASPALPHLAGSPTLDQHHYKVTVSLGKQGDNPKHQHLTAPTAGPVSWLCKEQALPFHVPLAVAEANCRQLHWLPAYPPLWLRLGLSIAQGAHSAQCTHSRWRSLQPTGLRTSPTHGHAHNNCSSATKGEHMQPKQDMRIHRTSST